MTQTKMMPLDQTAEMEAAGADELARCRHKTHLSDSTVAGMVWNAMCAASPVAAQAQPDQNFWPVDPKASRKQLTLQIGQMNFRLTAMRQEINGLIKKNRALRDAAQQPVSGADAVVGSQHDLKTSAGGRGFIAQYFEKRVGRNDFARYIKETLAADFACCLAQHLSVQPQAAGADAVRTFREYLSVHEVSGRMDGRAVDDMALDLARIAFGFGAQTEPVSGADGLPRISADCRAALLFVLWHHQGGSSRIGQPIRQMLGIGQHVHMTAQQYETAKLVQNALTHPQPSTGDADELPAYVIYTRPGMVPQRKGPYPTTALIEAALRELHSGHPDATSMVIRLPGDCYPTSGVEWIDMYGDKRNGRLVLDQPQPSGNALPPEERALAELVDKIVPGLDTGDLLADAATASKALDTQPSGNAGELPIGCDECGITHDKADCHSIATRAVAKGE